MKPVEREAEGKVVIAQAPDECPYWGCVPSKMMIPDPEIGAVGLTEAQARDRGIRVRTGTAQIRSSARGWIHKVGNDGFIKLIENADRGTLVGATGVGPAPFHRTLEDALKALK